MTYDVTRAAETALAKILNDASGLELQELDRRASFLELGFDSLFLIKFTQKIKSQLKVKITFRQLIEELPNIDALVNFVASHSPAHLLRGTVPSGEQPAAAQASALEISDTVSPAADSATVMANPAPAAPSMEQAAETGSPSASRDRKSGV